MMLCISVLRRVQLTGCDEGLGRSENVFWVGGGGGSFDTEMNERKNHPVMSRQLGNMSNLKPLFIILWHNEEGFIQEIYADSNSE